MARIISYEYLGNEAVRTVVRSDPNEEMTIPEKGEILVQNGKIWRVASIKLAGYDPQRESLDPTQVLVTLTSLHFQQELMR